MAKRVDGGPWRWYSYDGLQVIAEGTGTSDRICYTNSPAVVGGIVCRDATGAGGEKLFYHFDRLGNVVGITDAEGEVVRVYNQSAFGYFAQAFDGTGYAHAAADPQPYHLTTKELDPDIGLYYFNARWYDPVTGRFDSSDPIGFKGSFTLCGQNPVRCVDVTGKWGDRIHYWFTQAACAMAAPSTTPGYVVYNACECIAQANRAYDYGWTNCYTFPWLHFPDYSLLPREFERQQALQCHRAFLKCSCKAMGICLHYWQDMYAHGGFHLYHPPDWDDRIAQNAGIRRAMESTTRGLLEHWWAKCACEHSYR